MSCECGNGSCSCGTGGHSGCCCCCDCGGHRRFERRFATKEERINDFESYLEELKKEIQAVQERIDDLKK